LPEATNFHITFSSNRRSHGSPQTALEEIHFQVLTTKKCLNKNHPNKSSNIISNSSSISTIISSDLRISVRIKVDSILIIACLLFKVIIYPANIIILLITQIVPSPTAATTATDRVIYLIAIIQSIYYATQA